MFPRGLSINRLVTAHSVQHIMTRKKSTPRASKADDSKVDNKDQKQNDNRSMTGRDAICYVFLMSVFIFLVDLYFIHIENGFRRRR